MNPISGSSTPERKHSNQTQTSTPPESLKDRHESRNDGYGIDVSDLVRPGLSPTLKLDSSVSNGLTDNKHYSQSRKISESLNLSDSEVDKLYSEYNKDTEHKPRDSCCKHIHIGAVVGGFTSLRTFFIVSVSNTLGKLANIGSTIAWHRSTNDVQKALIGLGCIAVVAGTAIKINNGLAVLTTPCAKLPKLLNNILGYSPSITLCILVMRHLDATTKSLTPSAVMFMGVDRILSCVSRDFLTMLTRGAVPSLALIDIETSKALLPESTERQNINRSKATQAAIVYGLIVLAYFLVKNSTNYNELLGTDGKDTNKSGNLKSFENMFLAAGPTLVLRTIVEMLDDVNGGIALAWATYKEKGVTLTRMPVDMEKMKENFNNIANTLHQTFDFSSLRILNSMVALGLETLIPTSDNSRIYKSILQAIWGGWTEFRPNLVENYQKGELKKDITALNQEWRARELTKGSTDKELTTIERNVKLKTAEQRSRRSELKSYPTDLGAGSSIPYLATMPASVPETPVKKTGDEQTESEGAVVQKLDELAKAQAESHRILESLILNSPSPSVSSQGSPDNKNIARDELNSSMFKTTASESALILKRQSIEEQVIQTLIKMVPNTIFKIGNTDYQFKSYDQSTGVITARNANFKRETTRDQVSVRLASNRQNIMRLKIDNS
ncbi:hypothetical protein HC248_02530 [Polaromonas vacuolata]|uniref:Uncharacterized protein n=1 Tax=Polaromonas vacuolata TaxID=37448 RepID=A0A6H2HBF8_9BURK|nr:hypothetical protein [Polaromonas vacuolata]QJC57209.1 hypothetical protein HC248_02530 [Polaromonas vacuolata]